MYGEKRDKNGSNLENKKFSLQQQRQKWHEQKYLQALTTMSCIKRYVPLGNNSIVTDAPGWLSVPTADSKSEAQSGSTSGGPTCWKCKGRKLVPQKKKRKLRRKSTSNDQDVSHLAVHYGKECTVCHGLGYLAPKKKEVTSLSSQPGMITNRRKCPEGWHCTGPIASAVQEMMTHSPFQVDSNVKLKRNPLECLYLANNVENSGAGVSISPGEYPKYPWCPSNFGEQLCNLVGSWRILQRTGSHRWTTDDIVTARIGIQMALKRKKGHTEKKPPLRYLDLGCGNGSVLQMVSWGLLNEFELSAFGIEARSEAASLARRSLTFNVGEGKQASVIHGDFRELEMGSEAFKGIGNNVLNQLEAFRKTRSKKFDLVTGTPPYFRVDFTTASPSSDTNAAEAANNNRFTDESSSSSSVEVTAATINQGGMPTSIQSAPARCEFRGGIEAYCKAAVSVMHEDGIFCVCENWLNNDRVYSGASAAGLTIISVHPVKGKMGRKENLFAVYVMALSKPSLISPRILDPLCVRDKEGFWTSTYATLLETMSIPAMHMIKERTTSL